VTTQTVSKFPARRRKDTDELAFSAGDFCAGK
jgi:hypothetical protein